MIQSEGAKLVNQPETTEIVKEQLAELPLASAKVYVTVVSPTGNEVPEVWVLPVRVTVPELSVAVASA